MKYRKSIPFSFKPTASIVALSIAAAFALTACGGGGGGGGGPSDNLPSRVSASPDIEATGVEVNTPLNVLLKFSSQDGTSSALRVNLDALPAGWTADPAFDGCATVTSEASGCQLSLTYAPTEVTEAEQSLPITFTYTDDEGVEQSGKVDLAYSAVASAPSRVNVRTNVAATGVTVGTPKEVVLSFTSRNGDSSALSVSGLDALPAGWTADPAFDGCATVTPTASGCQLTLTYNPAAATEGQQSLPIAFTYTDDEEGAQSGTFNLPYSAVVGGGGGSSLGYITQLGATDGTGSILQCSADAAGMLTCTPSGDATALPAPTSIALGGNYAYVLNSAAASSSIYRCTVTAGALSACAPTGATEITDSVDLAVNGSHFYALKAGQLLQCIFDSDAGTVGECSDERTGSVTGLDVAESMAFSGNRVWIANSGGTGFIRSCDVDPATGAISNCSTPWAAAEPNPAPLAVALDTSAANLYVVLRDVNSVLRCEVGATGALTCDPAATELPAAVGGAQPERIAVSGNYLYVTRTAGTAENNDVIKCAIGADGAITAGSCASAISGTSPITGEITDIAF